MEHSGGWNVDLVNPAEIYHLGEDMKCTKTLAQELVHWRNAGGDVAAAVAVQDMKMFCTEAAAVAQGMKMFCTHALILSRKEKTNMAVMTSVFHLECLQCQVSVGQTM